MTALYPLSFYWNGEHMVPLNPRAAARQYTAGEVYNLEHREERSAASHAHYFAALQEAHANLPEDIADRFPTVDHMRRYALVRTGYRDERTIIASSKAEARRIAAFVKPMDEYAVVSVNDSAVIVWTAKSQSHRAMGKVAFQKSKDDVLTFVAEMIGVSRDALEHANSPAGHQQERSSRLLAENAPAGEDYAGPLR